MVHYFPSCFFRYHRLHNFDVVSVVRCRLFASSQNFAHLAISDETLRPHRVCNLCEELFVGETLLPSSKERFFLQSAVSWYLLKFTEYYFAGAHNQTVNEPTPEMTHFIFLESECFRRKILMQWNLFEMTSFFEENGIAIDKGRGHIFAIQRKRDQERYFLQFFTNFS